MNLKDSKVSKRSGENCIPRISGNIGAPHWTETCFMLE